MAAGRGVTNAKHAWRVNTDGLVAATGGVAAYGVVAPLGVTRGVTAPALNGAGDGAEHSAQV